MYRYVEKLELVQVDLENIKQNIEKLAIKLTEPKYEIIGFVALCIITLISMVLYCGNPLVRI